MKATIATTLIGANQSSTSPNIRTEARLAPSRGKRGCVKALSLANPQVELELRTKPAATQGPLAQGQDVGERGLLHGLDVPPQRRVGEPLDL